MENKTYFYLHSLRAFEVDDFQVVVAGTAEQARKWYKANIIDEEEFVYDLKDIKAVCMENEYYTDESRIEKQSLSENIREHLEGGGSIPFLAVTTDA